ncbi:MAG: ATP-dependent Clp protease adaptor ClpS [Deltaproteobacteria bacterium]|jgi:ATP-dependent Clp protease adaptor protein ClpS|nr:ATP-dependent Clp protease adaptor ClpS [Deltaproteobacteria bacterium]
MSDSQNDTLVLVEQKTKEPRKARVILLNDDYTTMDFVVLVLMEIFRKKYVEAKTIMLSVHKTGRGECGIYPVEVAETKVDQVHSRARAEGFPLHCLIEYV